MAMAALKMRSMVLYPRPCKLLLYRKLQGIGFVRSASRHLGWRVTRHSRWRLSLYQSGGVLHCNTKHSINAVNQLGLVTGPCRDLNPRTPPPQEIKGEYSHQTTPTSVCAYSLM